MTIACLTFTRSGLALAERLRGAFGGSVDMFTAATYKDALPRIFQEYRAIVFIGSTGLAVRLSAPFLKEKASDPAVVVMDDLGRYAISLISGHLGGANALADDIAAKLGCQPIITTASDGRRIDAVDLFARRHGLIIADARAAKTLTAMMVDGRPIRLIAAIPVALNYPHLVESDADGCICVTPRERVECGVPCCLLHPKILHVGIGCRKGKSAQAIFDAIAQVFRAENFSLSSISALATVAAKQDEPGLIEAAARLNAALRIFSCEEIRAAQARFAGSAFVERTLGVTAVSEPCAALSAQSETLLVPKTALSGVTVAVAQEPKHSLECDASRQTP